MTVNQDGIAPPNPTQTTSDNWMENCVITGHLFAALCGTAEFREGYHALLMLDNRDKIYWRHTKAVETELGEIWAAASKANAQNMGQITHTEEGLLVLHSTVNGTELRGAGVEGLSLPTLQHRST